ncbi:MAG: hypothetical protein HC833_07955 [Leptolyngbyaceae cyanobacterium RM1_406_9]|nr:hypothetical protein [Leptolyngbyaceae cyanobacterium RM1_406_9]
MLRMELAIAPTHSPREGDRTVSVTYIQWAIAQQPICNPAALNDALRFAYTSYKVSDRLTLEERAVAEQRRRRSLKIFCDRKALIPTSCRNDRDTAEAIVAGG